LERYGLDTCDSGQGPVVGIYEYGNENSSAIKGEAFLEKLSDY
jgi:hypothetical protein